MTAGEKPNTLAASAASATGRIELLRAVDSSI
jgi:hypothetical protein